MSHGRHTAGRHAKKINARRLTLVMFALIVGGLVLWAVIYSIVNPSPHGPEKHAAPTTSAPAPTHAKHAPGPPAPPPGCTCTSKPKPVHQLPPTPAHPLAAVYTVRPGDNLSSIAEMYRLPGYVPLYRANRTAVGNNPDLIHVGLHLTVPVPRKGS